MQFGLGMGVEWADVEVNASRDYCYRTRLPVSSFAALAAKLVLSIEYSNFKSAVDAGGDASYSQTVFDIWSIAKMMQRRRDSTRTIPAGLFIRSE
jgi:hypothetical protein